MTKIGIIAGGGELPLLVGKNLIKKNFDVTFFVLRNFYNKEYNKYNSLKIQLNSIKEILREFKLHKIDNIIMLGKVNRPSIKDVKFDFETIKFIKKLFLENKGDNKLLISIILSSNS